MQSLPVELLQKIGNEVGRLTDRKNMRAACMHLGNALKPLVLASVTINMYRHHHDAGMSLLHALVNEEGYSDYIRKLHIVSLAPFSCPDQDTEKKLHACASTWHLELDTVREWKTDEAFRQSDEGCVLFGEIEKLLGPAVKSLRSLKSIRWHWHLKDSTWALKTIMMSLSTLQHIKEFTFRYTLPAAFSDVFPIIPLPNLSNLEVLSLSVSRGMRPSFLRHVVEPVLEHLLSKTTSLSTLHLDTGNWGWHCRYGIRDAIKMLSPLDISHLNLTGLYWNYPTSRTFPRTLCKFTNLQSLELCRIPFIASFHIYLFGALCGAGIHLRGLATDAVTSDLLSYISSYSGLHSLSIKMPPTGQYVRHPVVFFEEFFERVLPLHRDTLVNLELQPAYEGGWCFSEANAHSFALCHRLRHLSVRVKRRGLQRYEIKLLLHLQERTPNPIHLLLNTINSSLPHLHRLDVDVARKNLPAAHPIFQSDTHPSCCICNQRRSLRCSALDYCHVVRKLIRTSFEHSSSHSLFERNKRGKGEPFDPAVLRWVKVYVGGERLLV